VWVTGAIRQRLKLAVLLLFSAAIPWWVFFGKNEYAAVAGLTLFVLILFAWGMLKPENMPFPNAAVICFGTLVIPYMLSFVMGTYMMEAGKYLVFLIFACSWGCDTMAYFTGKLLGKHKLAPKISAQKTVEGLAGGLIGACGGAMLVGWILSLTIDIQVNYLYLALAGLLLGFLAQVGDLSMSYIKREYGAKDYGSLLPEHGGVMDRFDSVIFVAPAVYLLLNLLPMLRV